MEPNASDLSHDSGATGAIELSERECEILRLVATGASNKQIAQQLAISPNTVKVHLRNIFGKIGVASRTEAALYAIREGLVQVATYVPVPADEPESAPPPATDTTAPPTLETKPRQAISRTWLALGLSVFVLMVAGGIIARQRYVTEAAAKTTATVTIPRWQTAATMPTALSGLAAVTYESRVYTIGGATTDGISGLAQSYDSLKNTWTQLAPKPIPVADVEGAIVGGLIYVPGGRTATGETAALEVYNPRTDSWQQRAPLPKAISAYAMVAFEGQLMVFGGWDGQHYLDTVYSYNPASDKWSEGASMPQARAYAGAAVAGGAIYIIGGENETGALATNQQYAPENNVSGQNPWSERAPLPIRQGGMGVTSIADIVYAIGGEGRPGLLGAWEYFPQSDMWQALDAPSVAPTVRLAITPIETHMFVAGGLQANAPTSQFLVYQAIYSMIFPIIGGP